MRQKKCFIHLNLALLLLFGCAVPLLISSRAEAQAQTVSLSLPAGFTQSACSAPVWKNTEIYWKGVEDKRGDASVGQQTKNKLAPVEVLAQPELKDVFNSALKRLLPACGLKLADKPSDGTLNLKVEIQQFYAGVDKKIVTGTGKAQSRIAFVGDIANQTTMMVEIGYQIESKKGRKKDIKQLEALLNELLSETLKQVPLSKQLQEFIH